MFGCVYMIVSNRPEVKHIAEMCWQAIASAARNCGIRVLTDPSEIPDGYGRDVLIIAIGGDGTMLEAMRLAVSKDATAVGVNLGRIGFLTDINVRNYGQEPFTQLWDKILRDKQPYRKEQRTMLMVAEPSGPISLAGNEVSISRIKADSMIEYSIHVNEDSLGTHRANSILISTATGSTAYALSAGGALLLPSIHAFQIVSIASTTLTSRPIVVDGTSFITIEAWGKGVSVRADGTVVVENPKTFTKNDPFYVTMKAFPRRCNILHLEGWNFFDTLSSKLGWIKE